MRGTKAGMKGKGEERERWGGEGLEREGEGLEGRRGDGSTEGKGEKGGGRVGEKETERKRLKEEKGKLAEGTWMRTPKEDRESVWFIPYTSSFTTIG